LNTCNNTTRIWLWQNGTDLKTNSIIRNVLDHPNIHNYYHSKRNIGIKEPTNWMWKNSDADFFGKVDDDCLVPFGWIETLLKAHLDVPDFGILSCWHFPSQDFSYSKAAWKIFPYTNGHKVMRNAWVGGSGYMMKHECVNGSGLLRNNESFTHYCLRLAHKRWIIGWYYPLLYQDHLDDPRSQFTQLKTDNDMKKWAPLSAQRNGVTTISEWQAQLQRSAELLQESSFNPKQHNKLSDRLLRISKRIRGIKQLW